MASVAFAPLVAFLALLQAYQVALVGLSLIQADPKV